MIRLLRSVAAIVAGYGVMSLTVIGGSHHRGVAVRSRRSAGGRPAARRRPGCRRRISPPISRPARSAPCSADGSRRALPPFAPFAHAAVLAAIVAATLAIGSARRPAGGAAARLVPDRHRRDWRRGRPCRRKAACRGCSRPGTRGSVEAVFWETPHDEARARDRPACWPWPGRPPLRTPTSTGTVGDHRHDGGQGPMTPAPLVLKKDGDKIVGTLSQRRRAIWPSRPP